MLNRIFLKNKLEILLWQGASDKRQTLVRRIMGCTRLMVSVISAAVRDIEMLALVETNYLSLGCRCSL